MKATTTNGKTLTGKTLTDIRAQLIREMVSSDLRAMTATTERGTVIHVEMYDGQDYIKTASGKIIR